MEKTKKSYVIFPVWVALNYVLLRTAPNIAQIQAIQIIRPLIVVGVVAALLTALLNLWLKEAHRAGALAAGCLYFFLYYGSIHDFLGRFSWLKSDWTRGVVILTLWALAAILVSEPWVWRKLKQPAVVVNFLNILLLALMLVPAYYIVNFLLASSGTLGNVKERQTALPAISLDAETERPDIYYIILDGYVRADVLKEVFDSDNTDAIAFLQDRGFYVAEAAQSNYIQTLLSLSSSLNLDYINEWVTPLQNSANRWPMNALIQNNRLQAILKSLGYTTVSVSSLFQTDMTRADHRFTHYSHGVLNEFESFLLSRTAAQWVVKALDIEAPWPGYAAHRAGILYAFEQLSEIPDTIPGPKFVFAHVLGPHPPFVLDREGNPVEPDYAYFIGDGSGYPGTFEEYRQRYPDELAYINTLLEKLVDDLLTRSATPPIIVVQADHGSGLLLDFNAPENSCMRERFAILNAYYLPGENASELYESITPVNSFRLILDAYFNTNLGFLEDRNYFSTWERPYTFIDVTEQTGTPCVVP